jgi:hypothetical protein
VVLDHDHSIRAVGYVSLNPVRARLADGSRAMALVERARSPSRRDDTLVRVRPVLDRMSHFQAFLRASASEDFTALRRAEATGRPLSTEEFVAQLEQLLGRPMARRGPLAADRPAKSIQANR